MYAFESQITTAVFQSLQRQLESVPSEDLYLQVLKPEGMSKDVYLALAKLEEQAEDEMAQGQDVSDDFFERLSEVTRLTGGAPWTLHPDHGCMPTEKSLRAQQVKVCEQMTAAGYFMSSQDVLSSLSEAVGSGKYVIPHGLTLAGTLEEAVGIVQGAIDSGVVPVGIEGEFCSPALGLKVHPNGSFTLVEVGFHEGAFDWYYAAFRADRHGALQFSPDAYRGHFASAGDAVAGVSDWLKSIADDDGLDDQAVPTENCAG